MLNAHTNNPVERKTDDAAGVLSMTEQRCDQCTHGGVGPGRSTDSHALEHVEDRVVVSVSTWKIFSDCFSYLSEIRNKVIR